MASTENFSYQELLKEFESTRKELGDTEESLKRITGRDPVNRINFNNGPQGGPKWKNMMGGPNMMKPFPGFAPKNRPLFPIVKKPGHEEEEEEEEGLIRESDDEDDPRPSKKPALASAVIAKPKDLKSRKESIKDQNVNSKVKARNRRMFGMILGTLQKFQHDAKKTQEQDAKRAEIEHKVEEAATEERERVQKEKERLFSARKEKQTQLRLLERKIEIVEAHELWEKNHKAMSNFILTQSVPRIYFLPAHPCAQSKRKLAHCKTQHSELVQERRLKMEGDIAEAEEWFQRRDSANPRDKENIFPEEEEEEEDRDETMDEGGPPQQQPEDIEPEGPVPPEEEDEENKNEEEEEVGRDSNQEEFEPIYD